MTEKIRLLFVDDEQDFLDYLTKRLTRHEIEVSSFTSATDALAQTEDQRFDVTLLKELKKIKDNK